MGDPRIMPVHDLNLTLADESLGQKGPDSFRQELKFVLPRTDLAKVRSILEVNCRRVSFNGPSTRVNSIYFDDPALTSCLMNRDGHSRRTKVRLRWYDTPFPEKTMFMEIKRRYGQVMTKDRHPINLAGDFSRIRYGELIPRLEAILPPVSGQMLMKGPEPVVIISYTREHFHAKSGPVRLTLDYNIQARPQRALGKPSLFFTDPLDDLAVLECKIPRGVQADLAALIHPLKLRVGRCSKYVLGCIEIGLITGAAGSMRYLG